MTEILQRNWALVVASVLVVAVALFVAARLLQDSRRGRLAAALGRLRERERALGKAERAVRKATGRLEALSRKRESVPPNTLLAAKDGLAAAEETRRLLHDQVLVVRNEARTVILEEYPPSRQEAMLRRLLREPGQSQ